MENKTKEEYEDNEKEMKSIWGYQKNKKQKELVMSSYMPSIPVIEITKKVKEDYQTGVQIMQKSYDEFKDKTLTEIRNIDQKAFDSYSSSKIVWAMIIFTCAIFMSLGILIYVSFM